MALTTHQRSTIYEHFAPLLGEEVAEALVSQFPANELDVPATKDFVRAECIALKSEVREEMGIFRTELKTEISELRTELKTEISELRTEVGDLRTEMHREFRLQLIATLTFVGALLTAFRLL